MTFICPGIDPFIPAWDVGEAARYAGAPRSECPYAAKDEYRQRQGWFAGWEYGDERMALSTARRAAVEAKVTA